MAVSEKTVASIEWESREGQAGYREVYNDGARSGWTSVPDMPTNLAPEKFQRMMKQIEDARKGQTVRFASPLPQRRF